MVQFQNIPEQLKGCKYCCWKRVFRNGRMAKLPINPVTGKAASTNDPSTFGTFEQARAAYDRGRYDGIGILVDSIAAFDIDHCVQEDGGLNELATEVLSAFQGTYIEISPSGTGLRGFFTVRQDFSFDKTKYYIKHGDLEIYLPGITNRFVTVTGNARVSHVTAGVDSAADGALNGVEGAGVIDCTDVLQAVLDNHMVRVNGTGADPDFVPHSYLNDVDVLGKAQKNAKFADCYNGNWQGYFPSQSEADLSVMSTLAFYCGGDMEQMDRLFAQSALMRDKYGAGAARTAYAERTMRSAIRGQKTFYDPEFNKSTADVDFDEIPSAKAESGSWRDETEGLKSLIASKPTTEDLYEDHNLGLAAYAYKYQPALFEALRALAKANGMKVSRYEDFVKEKLADLEQQAEEDDEDQHRPLFIGVNRDKTEYVKCPALARHFREHMHYILVQDNVFDTVTKHIYEHGVYVQCSEDRFKGHIKGFISAYKDDLVKMGNVCEVASLLNTDLTTVSASVLNRDENIINFENGLLHLDTMEMTPHSPNVLSTIQIPCNWTGKPSPTPVFDDYLNTLTDGDEEVAQLLLQFMGVAISNVQGWRMKKALFMTGEGDSGKSQIKTLTERLLGDNNFIGTDLNDIEARFGTSTIYRKRLAGSSDMSFLTVRELKTFKKCTGGDTLFAEFKCRNAFTFVYGGVLWFCMNRLPKFGGDNGKWVYDRIMTINCPNVIPLEKQDKKLVDKMYEEREGIVYKAVMELQTVLANGYRYSEPECVKQGRIDYQHTNDSALEFMDQCMVRRLAIPKRNDKVTVSLIYSIYKDWYRQEYDNQYFKPRKEFFASIAAALGASYDDMKVRTSFGEVLRDYTLNPEYFKENDHLLSYRITVRELAG